MSVPEASFTLVVRDGKVETIYDDALLPLMRRLGTWTTRRASHVEPEGTDWYADLSPVQGPKLGPFATREQALAAERNWLLRHYFQVIFSGKDETHDACLS